MRNTCATSSTTARPSTLRGYHSAISAHLLPAFGSLAVEAVSAETLEHWLAGFEGSVRTRNKLAFTGLRMGELLALH